MEILLFLFVLHGKIYLYKNNHTNEAKMLYFNNLDLINKLSLESNPICIKYALSQLGLIKNILRQPLTKIEQKNAIQLSKTLKSGYFTNI